MLAEALIPSPSPTGRRENVVINQAVTGMGGLGKTQLAVEFAYRYGRYYRGVHWLDLADPSLLDSEIAQCGAQMSLANFPADQPSQVALTLNMWKADGPRLLVLDNFEAVEQVDNVLTRLRHSSLHLLVTSRRTDWTPASGLRPLPLELFTPQESLAFLRKAIEGRKDKDDDLKILAERLGHLPLALELASRYLNGHPRLTITEYLTQLQKTFDHPSMRDWRKDHPAATQHDLDLGHTFALSWEAVKDEATQKLFLTAGYLAPNSAIPLEIFEKALEITSEVCDEALDILFGLGLLHKSEDNQPTIHPLLAEYARGLAKEKKEILESLFNSEHQFVAESLNNLGMMLKSSGYLSSARTIFEGALKIWEANLGTKHPNVAIGVNNLAKEMYDSGDLAGARTMYERAIKIDEANFGLDHPKVAISVNNLGIVLKASGDLTGARMMFERALKIDEAAFGPDHPNVAKDVHNLGMLFDQMGDKENAIAYEKRALAIYQKTLPSDHPYIKIVLKHLVSLK